MIRSLDVLMRNSENQLAVRFIISHTDILHNLRKQDQKDKNALTYQIAQRLRIVPCTISLTGKRGNTGQLMRIEVVTCVLHDRVWSVRCGTACWLCDCERSTWYVQRIGTYCVKIQQQLKLTMHCFFILKIRCGTSATGLT